MAELTTKTSLLIAEKLAWVSINYTLHGLLHHSVEFIQLNNDWSIGALSEEALESNHKFARRYLDQFSRKISPTDQLKDAMSRLIERSDPEIISHQRNFQNIRFCIICNTSHHMKKYPHTCQISTVENEMIILLFLFKMTQFQFDLDNHKLDFESCYLEQDFFSFSFNEDSLYRAIVHFLCFILF